MPNKPRNLGLVCLTKDASARLQDMKQKPRQAQMFETSDLPLFSGTPENVSEEVFKPTQAVTQEKLTGFCPLCLGTFKIGKIKCLCGGSNE